MAHETDSSFKGFPSETTPASVGALGNEPGLFMEHPLQECGCRSGFLACLSALRTLVLTCLLICIYAGTAFGAIPSLDEDDAYLEDAGQVIPDPIEPWNRAMYRVNDVMIEYLARPAYKGYSYVTPQFFRTGVKNFFHNLAFPVRFVNNVLQGRPRAAGVEMSRFVLNTTAGLGGLFDVAKHHPPVVPVEDEDFGQTLGVWGAGEGFYIVWPLLGPSNVRDSVGIVGDYFLDPVTYLDPWELRWGVKAGRTFNDLDDTLDLYDQLKKSAVEPYSSMRDAYTQYRRVRIEK